MKVINVCFYSDFDALVSAGYFKINEFLGVDDLNKEFILQVLQQHNLRLIRDNGYELLLADFQTKKKLTIRLENNNIKASNDFHRFLNPSDYKKFLKSKGAEEIKAKRVIVNSDDI